MPNLKFSGNIHVKTSDTDQGKRMKHFTPPESWQGNFHPVPLFSVYAGCRL